LWVLLHVGEGTHKLGPAGPPLEGATHKFDLDNALDAMTRRWFPPGDPPAGGRAGKEERIRAALV